ncbi:MAG: hypothetical protein M3R26_00670 [Actinomycetota bacterium]|nr:hypothetical protein [Actinomycetota bacterium]MDQ2982547.1 hypothetical protein [Actinomycetota bacterium]
MSEPTDPALKRRRSAASRYKPDVVDLLLVAEAPPSSPERYFYFTDVREHDSLFRYVCRVLLGREPSHDEKHELLEELRGRGVFLIDLKETPVDGTSLALCIPGLVERCSELAPRRIVLIKATVYDAAFGPLKAAGLPVCDERIPFPGSGRQREFVAAFRRAIEP